MEKQMLVLKRDELGGWGRKGKGLRRLRCLWKPDFLVVYLLLLKKNINTSYIYVMHMMDLRIKASTDTNWAGWKMDRRSTIGYHSLMLAIVFLEKVKCNLLCLDLVQRMSIAHCCSICWGFGENIKPNASFNRAIGFSWPDVIIHIFIVPLIKALKNNRVVNT